MANMFQYIIETYLFWVTVITCIFILITVLRAFIRYPEYIRRQRAISAIPGPSCLGSFHIGSQNVLYNNMAAWIRKYGKIIKLERGSELQYVTTDLGFINYITTNNALTTKARFFEESYMWMREGLVNSSGEKWQQRRKIIKPMFDIRILAEFIEIFEKHADTLVENLQRASNKSSVNIQEYIFLTTLDIIGETSLGVSLNAQKEPNSPYVKSVKYLANNIIEKSFLLSEKYGTPYGFTTEFTEDRKHLRIVHQFSQKRIKERREQLLREWYKGNIATFRDGAKISFLDILLQLNVNWELLDNDGVQEEVDTFMYEGHGKPAACISLVLYALAKYPKIQKKVYDEIKTIIQGKLTGPLHYHTLAQMLYFDMVIKEVMRLYTVVPFIGREIAEDFQYGRYTFLKNATILLYIQGVHMDPENFEDPETFNPDRWFMTNKKIVSNYLPFSTGLRDCLGEKYAMMEIKAIVSKVLMRFEIVPSYPEIDLKLASDGILKSINGIHVGLRPRSDMI